MEPNIISLEERKHLCSEFFIHAKDSMQQYKGHAMLLFIAFENQIVVFPNLAFGDKHEYTGAATEVAKHANARAIICICETFASIKDADVAPDQITAPSQDPEAREALAVFVSDPYANTCAQMVFFKKVEDQIVFEEEDQFDYSLMNMVPPWKETTLQ